VTRAAIYARISQDRTGAGLGVARQEADCRTLCERLGWHVVEVYVDNDLTAFSGRRRPEWDRLVADIKAGHIDAVATWHLDRLTRQVRELEDVVDLAAEHGLELASVTGELDLRTSTGRLQARMMGVIARQASEQASERLRRQRQQAADAGKFHGSPRPFGYESDGVTIREDEAVIVRECAARALAGESLHSICRDLDDRGIRTPLGNPWTRKSLRHVLVSARISGRREHRPVSDYISGNRPLLGEITADAVWPGIISAEDSDRLRELLTRPARNTGPKGRSYLLSGILRCHQCGSGLVGRPAHGKPRYVCDKRPGTTACGTISVTAEFADRVVRDMVLKALASPAFAERLRAHADVDPAIADAVESDERRLVELAEEWADGHLTRGEWRTARERIEDRLQANRSKLARATDTTPIEGMTGSYDELLAIWTTKNVSQRRAVIAAVLMSVAVGPSARKYDVSRFGPRWRV
jgi:site-specific DNA recombinase